MEQKIIKLSKQLISVNSSKEYKENLFKMLEITDSLLYKYSVQKYESDRIPSRLYFSARKKPEKFKLIFNAHLDVVPGNSEQFKPYVKDGKLFGRGAIDMKAAAAVEILVFNELAKNVDYPFGLQLVTDEETGGTNGTLYQLNQGVKADFAIVGEPTDLKINNEAKGVLWIKITAKGKSAHGAYPWLGTNAISKINEVINYINSNHPVPQKEKWKTTYNISKVETDNTALNKVPDICSVFLDIRYIDGERDKIIDEIKGNFKNQFEIEILTSAPSQFTSKENKFVQKLQKAVKSVRENAEFVSKHYATDLRYYTDIGLPAVGLGPIGAGLHEDSEWVDIQSLVNYYKILKNFVLSIK